MSMPLNLVLVRHGQSEGNVAVKRSRHGDDRDFTPDFRQRPSRLWRLTDQGREQARVAGEWVRENLGPNFFRYYVSEYVRARETAGLLDLPDATWYREVDLVERSWGDLDGYTEAERVAKFRDILDRKDLDPFLWRPPGGESLHDTRQRQRSTLGTLHRECGEENVVLVGHGEQIWSMRTLLERMTLDRFAELDASDHPYDHIHNCQVIIYSRVDPSTGEVAPYLNWVKSVCPTDLTLSANTWQAIVRPVYSNAELLNEVEKIPRLVAD